MSTTQWGFQSHPLHQSRASSASTRCFEFVWSFPLSLSIWAEIIKFLIIASEPHFKTLTSLFWPWVWKSISRLEALPLWSARLALDSSLQGYRTNLSRFVFLQAESHSFSLIRGQDGSQFPQLQTLEEILGSTLVFWTSPQTVASSTMLASCMSAWKWCMGYRAFSS